MQSVDIEAKFDLLFKAGKSIALSQQLTVTELQREQLLAFVAMIARWNKVYNLTAVRDPLEMLTHHIFDSLAAIQAMQAWLPNGKRALEVVDVGSGAGLPGVVMAILFPHWRVHCVDAVAKKTAFVSQVRAELELPNLFSHHCRIEEFALPEKAQADLLTCRAYASLYDFIQGCEHLATSASRYIALKGKLALTQEESIQAQEMLGEKHLEILAMPAVEVPGLSGERHLVIIGTQQSTLNSGHPVTTVMHSEKV